MKIQLELNGQLAKKILLSLIIVIALGSGLYAGGHILENKNPIPKDIKKQLSFATLYPTGSIKSGVDQKSFLYRDADKTLNYNLEYSGHTIILSEQPASGDTSNVNLVYYQTLGLHPVTEIQTKLGLAVLCNFYSTGTLEALGQDAVLAYGGTLLIAHPAKNLQPEQWKSILNSLHIYK